MMEYIWVLQCGSVPDSYHEDVFVLIKKIQRVFPDKAWYQFNSSVWYMIEGDWKAIKIERCVNFNTEAAQS